jgi:hypothetical protein
LQLARLLRCQIPIVQVKWIHLQRRRPSSMRVGSALD